MASSGASCDDDLYVEFSGLNEKDSWWAGAVRASYYAPPHTSFLLVTYVDSTVHGIAYEKNDYDDRFNADGVELGLDSPFSGEHVVQVVAYHDVDGDGRFDGDADRPCLVDGSVVTTGPARVNFSRFD